MSLSTNLKASDVNIVYNSITIVYSNHEANNVIGIGCESSHPK